MRISDWSSDVCSSDLRPRSDTVCTSLPPFATKRFEIAELIWIDPCAAGVDWSTSASWTCPCNLADSGSMNWIGSGLVNSLLAMRDTVTMIASPVWAKEGDAESAVRASGRGHVCTTVHNGQLVCRLLI